MKPRLLSLCAALVAVTLCASPLFAQEAASDPLPLQKGRTVSGELAPGGEDFYALELKAGRFVTGYADQLDVDVIVTVVGPDGEPIDNFDWSGEGHDYFQFDAEEGGTYLLQVTPFNNGEGSYRLLVTSVESIAQSPSRRMEQLLRQYDRPGAPGGVVAVVKKGKLDYAYAFGMANLTHDIPFRKDTVTNIGSTSKQFTAMAVLLLAQEGLLSLDDDVRTYMEELPDLGQTVTIRHLLTHTSGYREFLNALAMGGRRLDEGDFIDRDEIIALVQNQPELQNDPGAEFNYNNSAFAFLAMIVERVSGMEFPDFMQERVFEPLGMENSMVRQHRLDVVPGSAQGYGAGEGGSFRELVDLGGAMGAGGIYTTIQDLAKWMDNYRTGKLGGPEIIEQMTTPFVLSTGDTSSYGFGLFIDEYRGLRRIHHGGADAAHRSSFLYFPDLEAGVITQSNFAGFQSPSSQMVNLFFADYLPQDDGEGEPSAAAEGGEGESAFDPAGFTLEDFEPFAGQYELEEVPGFILNFFVEDSTLYTQATNQPRIEIEPTGPAEFVITQVAARVEFHVAEDGSVPELTLHQNGAHKATRLPEVPWAPASLDAYAGRYFSQELEAMYHVAVEDSSLVLRHRRWGDRTLTPGQEDEFTAGFPIARITFQRDENGDVTGFLATNGRTRDVLFSRQD